MITSLELRNAFENPSSESPNIIFIGMSGAGKSHWSSLLQKEYGINVVSIDELIGEDDAFKELIKDMPAESNVDKLGKYFGMPWESGHSEKERAFLEIEEKIMSQYAETSGMLIDTGGSSVYSPKPLSKMKENGIVIYLKSDIDKNCLTLKDFKDRPRPICWNNKYSVQEGETYEEAFNRSYRHLLETRRQKYREYADINVPASVHKSIEHAHDLVDFVAKEAEK